MQLFTQKDPGISHTRWNLRKRIRSHLSNSLNKSVQVIIAIYVKIILNKTDADDKSLANSLNAIKASRAGTRIITLIDGYHLLDLIAKYELYVTKKVIIYYELDDFFEKNRKVEI